MTPQEMKMIQDGQQEIITEIQVIGIVNALFIIVILIVVHLW